MPVHFKLSFFCLLFRKNEDKSEEGLAHDDWRLVPGLLEMWK